MAPVSAFTFGRGLHAHLFCPGSAALAELTQLITAAARHCSQMPSVQAMFKIYTEPDMALPALLRSYYIYSYYIRAKAPCTSYDLLVEAHIE